MNNFTLYNPVRILFGQGQTAQIDTQIPASARVLITYGGGSITRNGVLDEVRAALGNRHTVLFGGIEANPRYETLIKALPIIRDEQIDFILAVGGGSVVDGTKFIAAAARYGGEDPWDIVRKVHKLGLTEAMPFGVVLTLAATGSEMNCGAVITRSQTQEKLAFSSELVFPRFSVIDPQHTLSLPERQVANGVVDAFVHVVEQYLTYPVGAMVQDRFAEGLLSTLLELGPKVMADPQDLPLRANLSMSAMMALNGLIRSGVPEDWSTHLIGHELTALFGLDHALTLAIVLPHLLRDRIEDKREKLAQCGRRVFGLSIGDDAQCAGITVDAIERFFIGMMGATRLSDYGIPIEEAARVWERFRTRGWRLGERQSVDADAVERILRAAL